MRISPFDQLSSICFTSICCTLHCCAFLLQFGKMNSIPRASFDTSVSIVPRLAISSKKPLTLDCNTLRSLRERGINLQNAAIHLGISRTSLKKLCRQLGVASWKLDTQKGFQESRKSKKCVGNADCTWAITDSPSSKLPSLEPLHLNEEICSVSKQVAEIDTSSRICVGNLLC